MSNEKWKIENRKWLDAYSWLKSFYGRAAVEGPGSGE
jgi:hypothetical protein